MQRVIAIGNFDGVHRGHRAILAETCRVARIHHATPTVFTFDPHPRAYFMPDGPRLNLMTFAEKTEALSASGICEVIVAEFNAALAQLPAQRFATEVLVRRLRACHVVTGENFVFGRARGGTTDRLQTWLNAAGVGYSAIAPVTNDGGILSSSRIRAALAEGDVAAAAAMLGRPYCVRAKIHHGEKRGRTLGFPTLNLRMDDRFAPLYGVYTVTIAVGKQRWQGVANLGIRPSFQRTYPLLEAHAFGQLPPLYGHDATVTFHHYLRPEQAFETIHALTARITEDVRTAKQWFAHA